MKIHRERKGKKIGKKSVVPSFLTKLYQILENTEYHNIVKWADNGKAFIVKNLPEFIERVLPSYFKHNNFASFVRQLNMYDFHKTRNSNNENTFFHKMFTKGQKNLLKSIKRKVNNSHRNNIDDSELSEELHERENKINRKNNLEEIYYNLISNLESLSQRQKEIEFKVESIERKNDFFMQENSIMTETVNKKKAYTKNLEILIILILEYAIKKKSELISGSNNIDNCSILKYENKNNSNSQKNKEEQTLQKDTKKDIKDTKKDFIFNNTKNLILNSDEHMATMMKNLVENLNDNVVKNILEKSLKKYNLTFDDINFTFFQNDSVLNNKTELKDNKQNELREELTNKPSKSFLFNNNGKTPYELCETNMNSPTSVVANECLFNDSGTCLNFNRLIKLPLLSIKRKRTDDSGVNEYGSGSLYNFNQKEKDSMFEEITGITPGLISSPTMSPSTTKKSLSNFSNSNNIMFNIPHKNSLFYPENFYGFNLEENNRPNTSSNLINSESDKDSYLKQ